jgi:hypothetical protein
MIDDTGICGDCQASSSEDSPIELGDQCNTRSILNEASTRLAIKVGAVGFVPWFLYTVRTRTAILALYGRRWNTNHA